jgi:hypothetical protein
MTWEVLDIGSGDVLAVYDSFDAAKARLAGYVAEHPELGDELAVATVDDTGHAIEMVLGDQLVGASSGAA